MDLPLNNLQNKDNNRTWAICDTNSQCVLGQVQLVGELAPYPNLN